MDGDQQRAICRGFGKDRRDVLVLGDLDPLPIDRRAIRDPLNQPRAVFDASYDRIDRCLRELVAALASGLADYSVGV
jgi:protein-tyrosine-phosphatase